ncbi:uncharacterized protein LOC121250514 [Juglans microcarpa x Juglans regia]|uniref:uncharacterized protein LOC121250514 n=1 Tax=Juglans microcarpa x Juglans regia TaxID=2249226 RepID=UPI001B7E89C3|nr:uncharacterized protein LOC121250514 [Juglans microcarpa x Juglans regia]
MDSATTSCEADEWELYNDDGFVYKRKKHRLDPAAAAQTSNTDPEAEERNRRERKRATLLKLKARYQSEIDRWELLSEALRAMKEKSRHCESQSSVRQQQLSEREEKELTASFSSSSLHLPEFVNGSLVDELLLQVEAEEAVIHDVSHLCDVAEAMCSAQEERLKQSLIDLPIWASPHELIASLCDD